MAQQASPPMAERLSDLLRLAGDSSGGARVTLHLRRRQGAGFDLVAASDGEFLMRSEGHLPATLLARILESEAPVVVQGEGSHRVRVVARVPGWNGDVIGFLTFAPPAGLAGDTGAIEPLALQRLTSVATLVAQAVASVDRAEELAHANRDLRTRSGVDRRFGEIARDGGGLTAIVRETARLTGKNATLFDHAERQITSASPAGTRAVPGPAVRAILADRDPGIRGETAPFIAPSGGLGGLSRRKIVAPVVAAAETFGWLVIDEHPTPFTSLDSYVAQCASAHLGSELLVQRRVARMAWNARSALARSMIRGTQAAKDLMASAEYLGVDPSARRILVYVFDPTHASGDESVDEALATSVEQELGVEVLTTRGSEGVVLVIEAPKGSGTVAAVHDVKTALARATERICGPEVIVGVSTVCEPNALSRGYREAREVVHCIDRFAGRAANRVLAVDDLGPARLFLANSDASAIKAYVADVLGPLLTSEPGMADLLVTLQCYFDASRSVRASAARLGVHENTIRLRLARVATATGLDVAGDANDQLSVQTALLVLRLQGHPTLDAIGSRVPVDKRTAATGPLEPADRHTGLAPGPLGSERKTA